MTAAGGLRKRVIAYRFGGTGCEVGPSWVVTTLPGGAEVHAHPQQGPHQAAVAERLGYGEDLAALTRDHDPLHAALAAWLGLEVSPALAEAAGLPADPTMAGLEEDAVLALQRYCRALGRWPWGE